MADASVTVDAGRFWQSLEASAGIGTARGRGLSRPALSLADKEMRDTFVRWCAEAGCAVSVDAVGNIFARRCGNDPSLDPVLIGSHLDTQIIGGRYDGVLGVLAGLEIVRTLNDTGTSTERSIEVVSWTNEEGARFQPPMMGSGAFAGLHSVEAVLDTRDDLGHRFGDELKRIGYAREQPATARTIDSYFELHIEQGPKLDASGVDVGLVVGGSFTHAMVVDIGGVTGHPASTPMAERRNALVGAALVISATEDIGRAAAPSGKTTTTRVTAWPNRPGIIPSEARVTIDLRHPDRSALRTMENEAMRALASASERANVSVTVSAEWNFGDVTFDPGCIELLRRTASSLDVRFCEMVTEAGHDAHNVARVAPAALMFSPCVEGISHNEKEDIVLARTLPSVNVLLHAVMRRANGTPTTGRSSVRQEPTEERA